MEQDPGDGAEPLWQDGPFRIEACASCPLPGYLVLSVRGGCRSLADLPPRAADRLGTVLAGAVAAIEAVVRPERVYCLAFGEAAPEVHFHLFPRTLALRRLHQLRTGAGPGPVDGPALFQWARSHPAELPPAPDPGRVAAELRAALAARCPKPSA